MSRWPLRTPLRLASRSPRRRLMLESAGVAFECRPSDVDDALLQRGCAEPEAWVMALAHFKARRVLELLRQRGPAKQADRGTILGADTVCVHGDRILGQPRDEQHAREMLLAMRGSVHRTITGVCLLDPHNEERLLFVDAAHVRMGGITDAMIESYLASGEWRGKAGAYNFIERVEAGWPIECEGDPTTVMGLPMQRLKAVFAADGEGGG